MRRSIISTLSVCLVCCPAVFPKVDASPTDGDLAEKVTQQLDADFRLRDEQIEVRVTGGRVTLKGSVGSPIDKQRAIRIVRGIPGVQSVLNRIDVSSATAQQTDFVTAVSDRWQDDSVLRRKPLKAVDESGVLRLEGVVDTAFQRRRAERLAKEVRGVRTVHNNIRVADSADDSAAVGASDLLVERAIKDSLHRDAQLFLLPIQVVVEQGVVTISGEVNTLNQRRRAIMRIQRVPGVRRVKENLMIGGVRTATIPLSTEAIESESTNGDSPAGSVGRNVKTELHGDSILNGSGIAIREAWGIVLLKGEVPNMFQKLRATRLARQVTGVHAVENLLTVTEVSRSDSEILNGVQNSLRSDALINAKDITVSVSEGAVELAGRVDFVIEKQRARRLAARISGVRDIRNRITVRR